jgi:glucose-1-phosphate cytidylyltransferase
MVEIGGRPILWHVMKIYSQHGIRDFIICTGFKGYVIKEYFANYFLHMSDVTFDMQKNSMEVHEKHAEPWRVTLVDTGEGTMTGGRLKRVANYIGNQTFCMTYGDGVGDAQVQAMVDGLARRLEEQPQNLPGWVMLARSYETLELFDAAAQAYRRALQEASQVAPPAPASARNPG